MKKLILFLFGLGIFATVFWQAGTASAAATMQLTLTLNEFKVEMSTRTLPINTPIKITAVNKGAIEHEAIIEKAGAVDEAIEVDENNDKVDAEIEHVMPGTSKTVEWILTEPGDYQIACHTPGHYEAGMVQTFKVVEALPPESPLNSPIVYGVGGIVVVLGLAGGFILRRRFNGTT